jgi:hypothetical protein
MTGNSEVNCCKQITLRNPPSINPRATSRTRGGGVDLEWSHVDSKLTQTERSRSSATFQLNSNLTFARASAPSASLQPLQVNESWGVGVKLTWIQLELTLTPTFMHVQLKLNFLVGAPAPGVLTNWNIHLAVY